MIQTRAGCVSYGLMDVCAWQATSADTSATSVQARLRGDACYCCRGERTELCKKRIEEYYKCCTFECTGNDVQTLARRFRRNWAGMSFD